MRRVGGTGGHYIDPNEEGTPPATARGTPSRTAPVGTAPVGTAPVGTALVGTAPVGTCRNRTAGTLRHPSAQPQPDSGCCTRRKSRSFTT
ncbi:hypothetical protein F9278_22350 [Streptomyces phaeolivaceus]|uniref:Uncharacterized protein n=1 Tax=Streptomyces phaeolivaceus TaxID=2653200 RepID=A0A5P8K5V1_9ACTN|nr:hypothetical protein F9278_22350 [Streptomyces phaeolivaceus]